MHNGTDYDRPEWEKVKLEQFNSQTRPEMADILARQGHFENLEAFPGTLMGMHNALSTTIGLIMTVNHEVDPLQMNLVTLRS